VNFGKTLQEFAIGGLINFFDVLADGDQHHGNAVQTIHTRIIGNKLLGRCNALESSFNPSDGLLHL